MAKEFEPHMMYSKDGEEEMANTLEDHNRLSKTEVKLHSPAPFKMKGYTYPGTSPLEFKGANSSNSKCWPGKKKVGTKPSPTRPGVTVNDCK